MRGEAALDHDVDELGRRQEVAFVRRQDVATRIAILGLADDRKVLLRHGGDAATHGHARVGGAIDLHVFGDRVLHLGDAARVDRPVVGAAALDAVPAGQVDVVEQALAIALREVEHRVVGGDRVVDRLPEVPDLRHDRERQVAAGDHAVGHEANGFRRRVADALGQQAHLVMEIRHGPQAAVPPRRVIRPRSRRHARLAFGVEARVHGGADLVERVDDQRIEDVVEGIAEGRREHHRAGRAGLVMVVHDLREPLAVEDPVDVHRLRLVHHVEVAVVVVADVLLVEPRQLAGAAILLVRLAHVPVGDQLHAIGIGVRREDDDVLQDALRLFVVLADELVDGFDQLLRAQHFAGVQAAVDPDHGLAFLGQRLGLVVGQALGLREPARDLLVAFQLLEVLGRGDDRHQLVAAFGGLADRLHRHAIRFGVELAHVLRELGVVRELVIGADYVTEKLFRGGDPGRGGCLRLRRGQGEQQEDHTRERTQCHTHPESIKGTRRRAKIH